MQGLILNTRQAGYIPALIFLLVTFSGCEKVMNLNKPAFDPLAVFDEAWTVMDQHYAMFDVKGIDWNDEYRTYRSRISENMSDADLFKVIGDMLANLKDGHVTLISRSDTATYDNFYKAFAINFNYQNILTNYLNNDFKIAGPAIYKIRDNIGYIYYGSFSNNITDAELDQVFNEMSQTKGLIIDIRNNSGGNSVNADKLFSCLISEKKMVKYDLRKSGPGHSDFFDPQPFYLSPGAHINYNKPVVVLTNRTCFSSCNDFALYMSGLQDVKIFGDQTGGGGGIPACYLLANGWTLQYSAAQTLSPLKENVENGIQPDVNIGISSVEESNGRDPILEQAFQSLQ